MLRQPIIHQYKNIMNVTNPSLRAASNYLRCSFHTSKWNFIKQTPTRRKYDSDKGNSDIVKDSEASPPKKDQTNPAEDKPHEYPKVNIHEDFGCIKGSGGFNFLPVSTARVTIANKARDYIENIRRQKRKDIPQKVKKSAGDADNTQGLNEADGKSKTSGYVVKDGVVTPAGNYFVSASSKNDDKVTSKKKFFNVSNSIPRTSNVSGDGSYLSNKQEEISLATKGRMEKELEKAVLAFRKEYKDQNRNSAKDKDDVFSHRKVSSRKAGQKESLFHKYSVKKPGALNTEEFTSQEDINSPTKKPLKYTLKVGFRYNNPRNVNIPYSLSSNNSQNGSGKGIKKCTRNKVKSKSKKSQKEKPEIPQNKCDKLFTEMGLNCDENLRNKINGDLYMNFSEALGNIGAANGNKLSDISREDLLKRILSAGDEGSDETDESQRNRSSKIRKHEKSANIDKFWGIGKQNPHHGTPKWKIVSRIPKSSKRRKMKLRKRKSMIRNRKGKLNIKRKQQKKSEKHKPEECGGISQNE